MKSAPFLVVLALFIGAEAFSPQSHKAANKPILELKKAVAGTFAALTIGSSVLTNPIIADAVEPQPFTFSSTNIVAEKVVRQGLYGDYEVDLVQSVDDASSSFKSAKETKTKKVGSFIVPMAQYFWYVRDDDSSDQFFAEDVPEPSKKKKWF
eukprot:scaffold443_cov125-Cylindrotheca_fusiformis.AAC.26